LLKELECPGQAAMLKDLSDPCHLLAVLLVLNCYGLSYEIHHRRYFLFKSPPPLLSHHFHSLLACPTFIELRIMVEDAPKLREISLTSRSLMWDMYPFNNLSPFSC